MISDILERGRVREDHLWAPFSNDPFGGNKVALFGLYANTYLHGYAYLTDISGERLVQIVAEYDANMARLDADRQKIVIEIATKQYIDTIEQQIHDQQMDTRRADLDAKDAEFDAKFDALETDRLAILTKREQLAQAITKAQAEINILEARIAEEKVSREYVEVEISEKELAAAKTRLQILEAGLRGMDLQYEIANTAVQVADLRLDKQQTQQKIDLVPGERAEIDAADKNLDADISRTETARAMVDVDIAEVEVRTARTEMDVLSRETDTSLLDVDIAKAKLDTAMVDVEITETEARTAREEAKRIELETDTAMVAVRIAQIQLDVDKVQAQLKDIEADIANMDARMVRKGLLEIEQRIVNTRKENLQFEIPSKRDAQLAAVEKQIEVLQTKLAAEERYRDMESSLHSGRMDQQQLEHDHRMTMTELDDEYRVHRATVRIDSLVKDLELVSKETKAQERQDKEAVKVPESQIEAARDASSAAVKAAKIMASANIINSLAHQIGGKQ